MYSEGVASLNFTIIVFGTAIVGPFSDPTTTLSTRFPVDAGITRDWDNNAVRGYIKKKITTPK